MMMWANGMVGDAGHDVSSDDWNLLKYLPLNLEHMLFPHIRWPCSSSSLAVCRRWPCPPPSTATTWSRPTSGETRISLKPRSANLLVCIVVDVVIDFIAVRISNVTAVSVITASSFTNHLWSSSSPARCRSVLSSSSWYSYRRRTSRRHLSAGSQCRGLRLLVVGRSQVRSRFLETRQWDHPPGNEYSRDVNCRRYSRVFVLLATCPRLKSRLSIFDRSNSSSPSDRPGELCLPWNSPDRHGQPHTQWRFVRSILLQSASPFKNDDNDDADDMHYRQSIRCHIDIDGFNLIPKYFNPATLCFFQSTCYLKSLLTEIMVVLLLFRYLPPSCQVVSVVSASESGEQTPSTSWPTSPGSSSAPMWVKIQSPWANVPVDDDYDYNI